MGFFYTQGDSANRRGWHFFSTSFLGAYLGVLYTLVLELRKGFWYQAYLGQSKKRRQGSFELLQYLELMKRMRQAYTSMIM